MRKNMLKGQQRDVGKRLVLNDLTLLSQGGAAHAQPDLGLSRPTMKPCVGEFTAPI